MEQRRFRDAPVMAQPLFRSRGARTSSTKPPREGPRVREPAPQSDSLHAHRSRSVLGVEVIAHNVSGTVST